MADAYTVVRGDSLGAIARANGMTLAELLELNPQYAANPNLIRVGETVNLTTAADTPEATEATGGGSYVVVSGDNLSKIAKANGITLAELIELNPQYAANPNLIRVGDTIALPGGDGKASSTNSDGTGSADEPVDPGVDTSPAAAPEGAGEDIPGIMGGGTITKVVRPDQDDIWAISYTVNGVQHMYSFASLDVMYQALGPNALTSGDYKFAETTGTAFDAGVNNGSIFDLGDAGALVAQSGEYATFFNDIMQDAAISAGVRNPGMLGDYLADPEIQAIMGASIRGGWTPEQTTAEIRNTNFYQNVLYPGISSILNSGDPNPEAVWWQYHESVEDNLQMLGYEKDDDGSYRSSIGKLMEQGVSDTVFNQMAPVYQRAATDETFASTLDYWLDQTAGRDVSFDDIFDALSGQASGDLQVAVESAIVQYHADKYSTTLTTDQISRIATQTNLSEQEVARAFSTSEEALLALGDQGLERYGLTEEALVNAAFELGTGDFNAVEIRRLANKTSQELGLADNAKAQFYSSFNERGGLVKPGLGAAAPEYG